VARFRSLFIALIATLVLLLGVGGAYALIQTADRDILFQRGPGESAKTSVQERLEAPVRQATRGETIVQGEKALPAFAALGAVNGAASNRDRNMSRQEFLGMSGLGAAALLLGVAGSSRRRASAASSDYPFSLGVASGDPLPGSVVLWTRLAPDPLNGGGMPQRNVKVRWEVASDENFKSRGSPPGPPYPPFGGCLPTWPPIPSKATLYQGGR
jgi:hypothetical protein